MYFHIYDCDIQLASVFECCQYDGDQQWQQFLPYQYSGMSGSLHYGQPRQPSVSDSFLCDTEKSHQRLLLHHLKQDRNVHVNVSSSSQHLQHIHFH